MSIHCRLSFDIEADDADDFRGGAKTQKPLGPIDSLPTFNQTMLAPSSSIPLIPSGGRDFLNQIASDFLDPSAAINYDLDRWKSLPDFWPGDDFTSTALSMVVARRWASEQSKRQYRGFSESCIPLRRGVGGLKGREHFGRIFSWSLTILHFSCSCRGGRVS